MPRPEEKPLTLDEVERLIDGIDEASREDETRRWLYPEEERAFRERGVILIGKRIIFSQESKERISRALSADGNMLDLNPYEIAALSLMAGQGE